MIRASGRNSFRKGALFFCCSVCVKINQKSRTAKLLAQKKEAYKEYRKAKQDMTDWATAKYDIERFLEIDIEVERAKEQEKEEKKKKDKTR